MNKATKTNVAVLGTIFGISGISHGFFEMLQGNIPTDGLFISAIGEGQKRWVHGDEPAFTLIPNFLVTGIAAMLVGFVIVMWSIFFVHKKFGATIFLLLFILLLLAGGGVAQVIFFPFLWLVATRVNRPLGWWKKVLSVRLQTILSGIWIWCLMTSSVPLIFALEIAITGFVPGISNPETVLSVMLGCLVIVLIAIPMTFISGFAYDIAKTNDIVFEHN